MRRPHLRSTSIARSLAAAAGVLQKAWRVNLRRNELIRLVRRFLSTGIEEKSTTYVPAHDRVACGKLVAFFNSPAVLNSAKAMLDRICFLSSRVHGACVVDFRSKDLGDYTQAFVTAYAINTHLSRVGILCNPIDITVIKSARVVLVGFNQIVQLIQTLRFFCKIPKDLLIQFNTDLVRFNETYTLWEKNDHRSTWNKIMFTLVSLYFSYFCQTNTDPSARLVIKTHINQRRAGLVQSFGQGTLAKFDADLGAGRFGLPPIADTDALEALASDPRFFITRQLEKMFLVQEIIADVNFKTSLDSMKESPCCVYWTLSKNNGLYWSTLYLDLTSYPPSFAMVWQCLLTFKEQLKGIVVDAGRKVWVEEEAAIDDGRKRGWTECVDALRRIVDVIQKVQMPVKDKETASGWSVFQTIETPEVLVEALQFVCKCLKTSEIDAHNVKILLISNALSQNGVKYITGKFNDLLGSGMITMERTKPWIAAAVKHYMATATYEESNIRPLTLGGVGIVLYLGLHALLFRRKLLNHEKEFPEILVFDVWRICSLQRKMRIDAAALCTIARLNAALIELHLHDTDNGKLVMERVIQLFKSIEYGTRGLDDNSDVFLLPDSDESVFSRIKVELAAVMLPEHIASRLLECMDTGSAIFKNTLNRLANLVRLAIATGGGGVVMHEEEPDSPLFAYFASRVKKNIRITCKIFETMRSIHAATTSVGPLIESEVAKLM